MRYNFTETSVYNVITNFIITINDRQLIQLTLPNMSSTLYEINIKSPISRLSYIYMEFLSYCL